MTRHLNPLLKRRAIRATAIALLALFASMLWASAPVAADVAPIPLVYENQGWYWSSNKEIRQCVGTEDQGLCQVVDGSSASPVEPGHLAVALQRGASDMRSYLMPELGVIPTGATVTSMVLTLPISRTDASDTEHAQHHTGPGAKAPSTQNEESASIAACAVAIPWGNAEAAPPYSMDKKDPTRTHPVEPFVKNGGVDCNTFQVQGRRGAKAWTFDLSKIAQKWVDGTYQNNGVVLLPNKTGENDSWRVEFHGAAVSVANNEIEQVYVSPKEAGGIQVTFTPPVEPPPPPPPPPPTPPPVTGGGAVPPDVAPPPPPPATTDPTPQPDVQPESDPVAQPQPTTPFYVWLALFAGVAAFVTFSRAVGRETGTAAGNRVAEVLRRRRGEGGA